MTSITQASLRRPLNLSGLPTPATARSNLGASATGEALFTAASVAAAKTTLSLNNVDNTSDVNKPVSTAQAAADAAVLASSSLVHTTGNETVAGNKRFSGITYIGSAGDTAVFLSGNYVYLQCDLNDYFRYNFAAGDQYDWVIGGAQVATLDASLLRAMGDLRVDGGQLYFGGTSCYFNYSATDQLDIVAAGVTQIRVTNGSVLLNYALTVAGAATFQSNSSFASSGVPLTINSTNSNAVKLQLQDNGTVRGWLASDASYPFAAYNSGLTASLQWNGGSQFLVAGKAAHVHAGSYTSGQYTASTSAPSGGSDGDTWDQYV